MSTQLCKEAWLQATPGSASASHDADAQQLRSLLAVKESALTANQTRISKLEALHTLAQESAMKWEAELVSCHRALSQAQVDGQKLSAEAQHSRCVSVSGAAHNAAIDRTICDLSLSTAMPS